MPEPFSVRVSVRVYETDALGHLNGNVYLQHAEHARWELLRAAGINQGDLLTHGLSPVNLETTIRYHREVVAGDEVDVSCVFVFGDGKSFRVEQRMTRADGTLVAEVFNVGGILDLTERRLVSNPRDTFRSVATNPDAAGL